MFDAPSLFLYRGAKAPIIHVCSNLKLLTNENILKALMILKVHIFLNKSLCIFCSNTKSLENANVFSVNMIDFKWVSANMVASILCYQIKICLCLYI